jgi:hypothetical protein
MDDEHEERVQPRIIAGKMLALHCAFQIAGLVAVYGICQALIAFGWTGWWLYLLFPVFFVAAVICTITVGRRIFRR